MEKSCDTDVVIFNGSAKSSIWIEKELGLCQRSRPNTCSLILLSWKKRKDPIGRECKQLE